MPNPADYRRVNVELCSDIFVHEFFIDQPSYSDYITLGQFRIPVMSANITMTCAVNNLIVHIIGMCAPLKIINRIIAWVPVQVSSLAPIRAWASECLKDQSVDIDEFVSTISAQAVFMIPARA